VSVGMAAAGGPHTRLENSGSAAALTPAGTRAEDGAI
jgi:hypothetical protein